MDPYHNSDQQTDYLFERLKDIEVRTEQMRQESERLRRIKDEAKMKVARKFPHLFPQQQLHGRGDGFDEISAAADTTSSSSISSGDLTKSEGDAEVYGARSGARMSTL